MQPVKETSTGHVGSEVRWQTSLRGIAKKATENKTHRFGNLYKLLNVEALREAFHDLKKKAAGGVDNITAKDYAEELESNLGKVVEQLKSKQYRISAYMQMTSCAHSNTNKMQCSFIEQ